jgi:hypothetical protein
MSRIGPGLLAVIMPASTRRSSADLMQMRLAVGADEQRTR